VRLRIGLLWIDAAVGRDGDAAAAGGEQGQKKERSKHDGGLIQNPCPGESGADNSGWPFSVGSVCHS
jgi:hypothetical protein